MVLARGEVKIRGGLANNLDRLWFDVIMYTLLYVIS